MPAFGRPMNRTLPFDDAGPDWHPAHATILLVEDDAAIARMLTDVLNSGLGPVAHSWVPPDQPEGRAVESRLVKYERDPACPACGDHPMRELLPEYTEASCAVAPRRAASA